jgi:sulfate adenylyltransferase
VSGSKQTFHGGKNTASIVSSKDEKDRLVRSCNLVLELNERQSCDVELVMNGGFSPLNGFMDRESYESVVQKHRLPKSDLLFGLPVVLDTNNPEAKPGKKVLLRYDGTDMAVLEVSDRFTPNKPVEALKCYKTTSIEHPGVRMISMERAADYIGGKITGLNIPKRPFPCQTPDEVRASLPKNVDVVAFQCRNPVHRAHYELFIRSLDHENVDKKGGAVVLVHPTMGPTQEDDISGIVRYKTYEVLKKEMNNSKVHWAFLPYSMHMAGPREALQHMLLRKNFGCTHFIIGRDMAGSKSSISGDDFYGPYDAQNFAKEISTELGMKTVPSLNLVYTKEDGYITADVAEKKGLKVMKLSGTEFRRKLRAGEEIPEWFAFKSVVDVLRREWK